MEQKAVQLTSAEFSALLDAYISRPQGSNLEDSTGRIHYINANDIQLRILYAITRQYPYFETCCVEPGTEHDEILSQMTQYGIFSGDIKIARKNNFIHRLVILDVNVLGPNKDDIPALGEALSQFYRVIQNDVGELDLTQQRPQFIYLDGLEDYIEYRKLMELLASRPQEELWSQTQILFIDTEAFQLHKTRILEEQFVQRLAQFTDKVGPQSITTLDETDPNLEFFFSSDVEHPPFRLRPLLRLYYYICSLPQEYFILHPKSKMDPLIFAAFAAAFISHQKKLLVDLAAYNRIYNEYIFTFNAFEFGSILDKIERIEMPDLNTGEVSFLRVTQTGDAQAQLSLLRETDVTFKYKVVSLEKLLGLLDLQGEITYKTDADDFDSCGRVYSDGFDLASENTRLIPVLEALGCDKVLATDENCAWHEERLHRILRLIDQYVHEYTDFSTLRDLIVIEVEGERYIGVASLDYTYTGDILSLGETNRMILPANTLPAGMYDTRLLFDWNDSYMQRVRDAYATQYHGTPPSRIILRNVAPLSLRQIQMALYWACDDEFRNTQFSADCPYFDMMLANNFNHRAYVYMRSHVLEVLKPFGFRGLSAKDSPLNSYGGFNYVVRNGRPSIHVMSEVFRTFPGVVKRSLEND